jgi:hypothetical protein
MLEIQKDGKNFLVGVHFNQARRNVTVSDIRGIFPKDNAEWLNWINQGKFLYMNKEKIQELIDKQRKNLADVEYLDLDSVANVIECFENPSVAEEKVLFRVDEEHVNPLENETVRAWDELASSRAFLYRETAVDYLTAVREFQDLWQIATISRWQIMRIPMMLC